METTKVLMIVAVFAVAIAVFNVAVTFVKLGELKQTGYAGTEIGNATLEIIGVANIQFTQNIINWSDGTVDVLSYDWANLTTNATITGTEGNGTCTSSCNVGAAGTFNNVSKGLVIENIGSSNVSLRLESDKNALTFIGVGGSGIQPLFKWSLNQVTTDDMVGRLAGEPGSCKSGGIVNGLQDTSLTDVFITGSNHYVCGNFSYDNLNDEIEIDLNVRIPEDAPVGTKLDTLTVTAQVINT